MYEELSALAARNRHADAETTFLGAGMYDHYVPALIDTLLQPLRVPHARTRRTSPRSRRAASR